LDENRKSDEKFGRKSTKRESEKKSENKLINREPENKSSKSSKSSNRNPEKTDSDTTTENKLINREPENKSSKSSKSSKASQASKSSKSSSRNPEKTDSDTTTEDILNRRVVLDYPGIDRITSQDRPQQRDKKSDELYKSFVQKIIDLLGVGEEEAKKIRAALKLNLVKNNPSLAGRKNDTKKVEEIAKILESKEKLQKELKKNRYERNRKNN